LDVIRVAGINEVFKGMTMAEARQKMLGLRMDRKYDHGKVQFFAPRKDLRLDCEGI
jgi:hypothetical protein